MITLLSNIRNEYKSLRWFLIRVGLAIFALPIEMVLVLLGTAVGYLVRIVLSKTTSIAFSTANHVVYEDFATYWLYAVGILLLHVLLGWLVRRWFKPRIYFELLIMQAIAAIFMSPELQGSPSSFIMPDLGFSFAVLIVFALMQYLIFLAFLAIVRIANLKHKDLAMLLAFCIAAILGYFLSSQVWDVLFYIYIN